MSRTRLLAEDLLLLSCDETASLPRLGRAHAAVGAALVVDAFLAGMIIVNRSRVHTTGAHPPDAVLAQVARTAAKRRVPTMRRLVDDTGIRPNYYHVRSRLVADGLLHAVRRYRWGVFPSIRYQAVETAALVFHAPSRMQSTTTSTRPPSLRSLTNNSHQ